MRLLKPCKPHFAKLTNLLPRNHMWRSTDHFHQNQPPLFPRTRPWRLWDHHLRYSCAGHSLISLPKWKFAFPESVWRLYPGLTPRFALHQTTSSNQREGEFSGCVRKKFFSGPIFTRRIECIQSHIVRLIRSQAANCSGGCP